MAIENDVSASTLIISAVIAGVGWVLKGAAKLLVNAGEALVKKLVETISKVETLDSKINQVVQTIGNVEKTRTDLNEYYKRLKALESEVDSLKQ